MRRIDEGHIPLSYRPMEGIRGMSILELADLQEMRKAIAAGSLISLELDDSYFDPTLAELIAGWSQKFNFCFYLGCRVPNTPIITYYVVTVNLKNMDTPAEQLVARSMLYSMRTNVITRLQMKELFTTFRVCGKLELDSVNDNTAVDDEVEEEDADHPLLIQSLDDIDKMVY